MGFDKKKFKKWAPYWLILSIGLFISAFVITGTWIGVGVKDHCQIALGKYRGDCVEALITTVANERESFRTRNNGIWSLGQLGDSRALPLLESMYTGNIPEREPYDAGISHYELKKAIALTKGGFNITAFVWRWNLPK